LPPLIARQPQRIHYRKNNPLNGKNYKAGADVPTVVRCRSRGAPNGDRRLHNYPPRRNGAPSQDLLVITSMRLLVSRFWRQPVHGPVKND